MEEKELFQTTEEVLVLQVCEILKENNINYIRRDEGVGSYLNVAWGNNTGIKKIFVKSEDYEKSLMLMETFKEIGNDCESSEIPEELREDVDEEMMEKEINKYKSMKCFLFVGIPLIMMIIVVISIIIAV